MTRRVVITGTGMVTPLGVNVQTTWDNLIRAQSGIDYITLFDASAFPVRIAGEVKDFDFSSIAISESLSNFTGRATSFCLAATQQAIENAALNIEEHDPAKIGVSLGASEETNSLKNFSESFVDEDIYRFLTSEDRSGVWRQKPFGQIWPLRKCAHMTSHIVSIMFNLQGPLSSSSTACASGTHAIGKAMRLIEHGDVDVMVAGGTDSCLSEFSVAGFYLLGALSENNEEPARASRPFDLKRNGFVLAEGAGILILEELQHALKRGAPILAELKGYGTSSNAYRITDSPPDGRGPDQAMQLALNDAGMSPEDISHINSHGTSTMLNDRSETISIKKVFGETAYQIPIGANKSMIGHPIAGAGAIELIVSVLSITNGMIPPTINYEMPDPACDLDYVPNKARECAVETVMSNSFAFGGQNASLVVARYRE
jgi:3-oxoacyl-[acyl-carrier-protein] synthase II